MNAKTIVFTKENTAEVLDWPCEPMTANTVKVRMEYTVVSGGTERACLVGSKNTSPKYPKILGYCGVGHVIEIGEAVTTVTPGDHVLVYHGNHAEINVVPEIKVTKITQNVYTLEAAFVIIASMGLGGVRKLELELGESAMVMGLGLLGLFSIQFLRLSGAYPLIAADPNPERRRLALQLGADHALDPMEPNFRDRVKALTGNKGVKACVEVTGVSVAMKQALECASRMGRIALLGCTRVSNCEVDYYARVHRPGVTLIGAHNSVRPLLESYPHHWTHQDDCTAILNLLEAGRIAVKPMISRVEKPEQAPEIYKELVEDPNFPLGTVFDWR